MPTDDTVLTTTHLQYGPLILQHQSTTKGLYLGSLWPTKSPDSSITSASVHSVFDITGTQHACDQNISFQQSIKHHFM
jgi:hypothetical protein